MAYIARLRTSEGDEMEVRHQSRSYTTRGPDGMTNREMVGGEESWNYANDIGIFVRLSGQRDFPVRIVAEISSRPAGRFNREYEKKQYELEYIGEKSFFCEIGDRIVISAAAGSELRNVPYDQYINFTLIYEDSEASLVDPLTGNSDFRMTLEWAEEI